MKDPTTYSSGTGYWVDYYDSDSPWGSYIANHIEWTVDWGDIKVYFIEEGTSMVISDYHLDDSRFWGTINDGGSRVEFELYHTSSPNYNGYNWGYSNHYRDYYRTRGDGTTPDKPVRFVRGK